MLEDAVNLSKDAFKEKWKTALGDEYSGRSSKARYRKMKESHDLAKNRLFTAAAATGMTKRLGEHIKDSAEEAQYKRASPAAAAALREKIAEILAREKQERFSHYHGLPTSKEQRTQPVALTDMRPAAKHTPASSSTEPLSRTHTRERATLQHVADAAA